MKIKPVTTETKPNYPDKYNEEIRRILTTSKPTRWVGTPLVGVLSAAVALGLGGCVDIQDDPSAFETPGLHTPSINEPSGLIEHVLMGDVPMPTHYQFQGTYIPLFEFGDGTGGIGCVAIVAPVFMSEEEAFEVISAAFAEAGLHITRQVGTLEDVNIPITNLGGRSDGQDVTDPNAIVQGSLKPDGMLTTHDLPIAFVSTTDVANWHKDIDDEPRISWSTFHIKQAARTLADNNAGLVVFYDPVAGELNRESLWDFEREDGESDEAYNERYRTFIIEKEKEALVESEQLLRQQVEAFISWLFEMS